MACPVASARSLERLFAPYERAGETTVRVWGTDAGPAIAGPADGPEVRDAAPPRLLCLAGGPSLLAVVRHEAHDDALDGFVVPWSLVRRVLRAPAFRRDVLTVEIEGRGALRATVAAHLLLPRNRAAGRALCVLADACCARGAAPAPPVPSPPGPATAPEADTRPIPTA
jgi:hypothetical protein